MKASFLKPGFEFIFALSLTAILGLPIVLKAQAPKDLEIRIENGDTTVNGKNIKDLSAADRQNALRDIDHLAEGRMRDDDRDGRRHVFVFKQTDSAGHAMGRFEFRRNDERGGPDRMMADRRKMRDSLGNVIMLRRHPGGDNIIQRFRDEDALPGGRMELRERDFGRPVMRFERRNSQHFDYVNTDNEGISTHLSFQVSDASNDDPENADHAKDKTVAISDLNIVPEFSSGKILLLFNLPAKTTADVKLSDSQGKLIWSEKTTGGSFSKSFALGLNGVYHLRIKQGNGTAVKRIVKEE